MIRRHAASLLLLGVFIFVFFYDVWLLGRVWFDSPGIYFYFPWRMDSRYTLFDIRLVWGPREGIPFQFHLVKTLFQSLSFPLWNPYLLAGEPFFATGHKQVLDLTNFIYFFAGLPGGMNLQITLQVFLAGAFMYILAHRWTRDRLAASVAAVAYAFSGHVVSKTYWAPNIGDAMWIPLGILFADLAAVSGRVRYFVLYGMVLSAIFLGGSETHVPLIFLFLLMYLAVRLLGQWRRGEWPGPPAGALWLALLSFGVFVGISAVRLIPLAQHILLSDRSMPRPTPEWVLAGAQPYEILRLVVYTFLNLLGPVRETVIYRGDVRNSFFLGVAALFLVLPRLRRVASGRGAFFFWSALLSIPFAALSEALLLGLIQVPALSRVAYLLQSVVSTVDRVSIFYVAGVPLLCAFGVRELREDLRRGLWARWMKWGAAMAAGLLAWMILVRTPWAPALTKVNAYFFFWPSLGAAVLLAAALFLRARSWIPQRVLGGLILAVLFSELMIGTRLVFSPAPREEFYPEMPGIRFLKSRPGLFRVDHMTEGPHLAHHSRILLASLLLPFEIQTITGYETVLPRRHHELFSAMATPPWAKRPVYFYNYVELTPRSLRSPLLDLFNVRYLLLSVDFPDLIPDDRYRLVYSNEIRIYENKKALPRAFVVHDAKVIREAPEILRHMTSPGFDPGRSVLLEDPEALQGFEPSAAKSPGVSQARVRRYEPERVAVDAEMERPGFLVLGDSYFPGWRVTIDGRPGKIWRADYLFRAVRLDPGRHRVEFVYAPKTVRYGLLLTGVTLVLALGLLVAGDRRTERKALP